MRLHRFYIKGKRLGKIELSERFVLEAGESDAVAGLLRQWKDVFRYITGNRVAIFDDSKKEYIAIIESLSDFKAELVILEKVFANGASDKKGGTKAGVDIGGESIGLKDQVWIFASIIKNDNFDFVVQKATELGVDVIVPIVSERTIKKNINLSRAQKIATEAAEQSGRVTIPEVLEPAPLKKALQDFLGRGGDVVVCSASSESQSWTKLKSQLKKYPLGFVIGPEGGWSPKEEEYFKASGFKLLSLGENILRAETAVVAAMTLEKVG